MSVEAVADRSGRDETRSDLRVGLVMVFALSGLAGAVDACGLAILKDLFVSFMSGNSTSLAVALGQGDIAKVRLIAPILVLFVLGATAGTVLALLVGRRHPPVVVLAVAAVLAVPIALPPSKILAMTFAMGMLNAAMNRAGPVNVSVTYVTGTLVRLGNGLGHLVCGQAKDWTWLQQGVPWIGLVSGGFAAALSLKYLGHVTVDALPLAALLVAGGTWVAIARTPPSGAPT